MRTTVLDALPDDLLQYEENLKRIVPEGLSLYIGRYGMQRGTMSVKTERCAINDCLKEVAKKFFPNQYIEKRGLFLLCLGAYRIKLKKLNKKLRPSNHLTQLVLDFLSQKLDDCFTGDLFSLTPVHPITVHLGYIPDDVDLLSCTGWLTKPNMLRNEWIYELKSEASQSPGPTLQTPPPSGVPPKPTVTPKLPSIPETGEAQKAQ